MIYVLIALCLLGAGTSEAQIQQGPKVHVLSSSPTHTLLRTTFEAAPGKRVPLGLMAAAKGTEPVSDTEIGPHLSVEIGDPVMIRELRAVPITLACDESAMRETRTVEISLAMQGAHAGMAPFKGYMPASYVDMVSPHVINWNLVELEERSPGLRYLILVADDLEGAAYPIYDWKQRKGLGPQMTKLSDIPGGTSDADIREYIQTTYQNTGTLEYVLLIGDYGDNPTGIPAHRYYNQVDGGYLLADKYYATISGGDDLPDVFLGRLSANSPEQLGTLIDKTLAYERGDGDGSWMEWAVMASGNQHPSHKGTKRLIRDQLLGFGYDMVDTVFAPDQSAVDLITSVNEGRTIVNYRGGVADREQWNAINFTQDMCYFLGNGLKRPLVVSVICLTGDFSYTGGSYGECLGESWVRCPGGAVAFFGASHITHTFANNTLDLGIYDGLVNQGLQSMGAITDAGLYYLFNNYAYSDTVQIQLRQYALLGDPELPFWHHEPYSFTVDFPASVPLGPTDVTVSTGAGGALVCLRGAGVYEAVYADGSGNAYFSITPSIFENIDVTVTMPGFFPYEGQMAIAATYSIGGTVNTEDGGALQGATVALSGDATDQATTNVDGWYEFGGLDQGGYFTITPSYSNAAGTWTFDPEGRTYENLQGDQWGQDYTSYAPRYTVGGIIRNTGGIPLEGVTVTLSGYQTDTATTNQDGWFQFSELRGGKSYTLTPSYVPGEGAWVFDPESRTVEYLDQDRLNQNFTGSPPYYGISGVVTAETGEPVANVAVVLTGDMADTAYTDDNGAYSLGPLAGGSSYDVTPAYVPVEGAWTFTPESLQFAPLTGPETNANFQGIRPRYEIAGTATTEDRAGLENVVVNLSGAHEDSVLTDGDGAYVFADLPGGFFYEVSARLAFDDSVDWGFNPEVTEIDTLIGSLNDINFLARLPVILSIGDGLGEPGSSGNTVDIVLDNESYSSLALGSLDFTLLYTAAFGYHLPDAGGVVSVGRASDLDLSYTVDETNEAACSLFVSLQAPPSLVSGNDVVLQVLFDVSAEADTSLATELSFVASTASDTLGEPVPVDDQDTGIFGAGVGAAPQPEQFRLLFSPPMPNPTTGDVTFSFQIPRNARTTIVVRDLNGRVVTRLPQGLLSPGRHSITWDGKIENGRLLSNGAYHCQLVSGGESANRLVVFLR